MSAALDIEGFKQQIKAISFKHKATPLSNNPFGDEGLAALLATPRPAGALSPPTGGLAQLRTLGLSRTQISDAGCAALTCALESGALSARLQVRLTRIVTLTLTLTLP